MKPGESLLPMNSVANPSVVNVKSICSLVCLSLTFVRQLVTSPVTCRQFSSIFLVLMDLKKRKEKKASTVIATKLDQDER